MLGGLDNDEMDCLEDSFDFIVLVTSSGTTNESSVYGNFWTKKENRETKLSMLLKSVICAKNGLTGLELCPALGVGLLLHDLLLLLVLLLQLLHAALNYLLLPAQLWSLSLST